MATVQQQGKGITAQDMRAARPFSRERRVDFAAIPEDDKWWVGGQFDGDGCVRICPINGLMIRVGKAENAYATLVHLQKLLGGMVHESRGTRGERMAEREWHLRGQAALDFCEAMQPYTFLKRPQLARACEFPLYGGWTAKMQPVKGTHRETGATVFYPSVADAVRRTGITGISMNLRGKAKYAKEYVWEYVENPVKPEDVAAKRLELERALADLKKVEHEPIEGELPLPYVAGFVDADGCVRSNGLQVTQKYRAICDALKRTYGGSVIDAGQVFRWSLHCSNAMALIGQLHPFLVEKKPQVNIWLDGSVPKHAKDTEMSKWKKGQGAQSNAQNRAMWQGREEECKAFESGAAFTKL